MAENPLGVEVREGRKKGAARKLRAAGRIPGVCYRPRAEALPIQLDPKALDRLLKGSAAGINTLIDLSVAGGGEFDGRVVMVKELQRDPVSGQLLHADLYAVDLQQSIEVSVPIQLVGRSEGVEMGGILDHSLRELELECLATAIPEQISIDVSPLLLGQSLHVRDLELPSGVTLRSDPDISVVSIVAPAAVEEPVAAEEVAVPEGEEAPSEEGAAEAPPTEEEKGEKKSE